MNHSLASPGSDTPRAALLDRRLTACLLAAGGMLAGGQAQAGIVYSGLLDIEVTIDPATDSLIDCDEVADPSCRGTYSSPSFESLAGAPPIFQFPLGDGGFSLGWIYALNNPDDPSEGLRGGFLAGAGLGGFVVSDDDFTGGPVVFESDDVINGTELKVPGVVKLSALDEMAGLADVPWLDSEFFIGIGVPVDGNLHSGWFHVGVPAGIEIGSTFTILGWAYCEAPNSTIQAGQTEAASGCEPLGVPEPSVPSLLLLGLGAAGVAGWRRRRAAERAEFRKHADLAQAA